MSIDSQHLQSISYKQHKHPNHLVQTKENFLRKRKEKGLIISSNHEI